jgi:hypothetical protein
MARRSRVNATAIASLFLPSGDVGQHGARLIRESRGLAQRVVPVRTGELKRSIGSDRRGSNQYQARFALFVTADHGPYVLLGTLTTPPRPRRRGYMVMYARPRNPAAARPRYHDTIGKKIRRVRGQRPNDFLGRSLDLTMRRNGY